MTKTFRAKLRDNGTFVVPLDVRALFGSARPAVKMTIERKTYPTRIAVYGGKYILGIWKAVREKEGLEDGDTISVTIASDEKPRTIKTPPSLARALKKNARARKGWAKLSFTHKREWANAIREAKKKETKARRIAQCVKACAAKA